jgi:transcriptional regulator with GAF, ATPase, and Fis domain
MTLADAERRAILDALARSSGNQAKAARALGVSRMGLRLKMRRHGLAAPASPTPRTRPRGAV